MDLLCCNKYPDNIYIKKYICIRLNNVSNQDLDKLQINLQNIIKSKYIIRSYDNFIDYVIYTELMKLLKNNKFNKKTYIQNILNKMASYEYFDNILVDREHISQIKIDKIKIINHILNKYDIDLTYKKYSASNIYEFDFINQNSNFYMIKTMCYFSENQKRIILENYNELLVSENKDLDKKLTKKFTNNVKSTINQYLIKDLTNIILIFLDY